MFFGHYKGKINLRYAEIRRGRANGKRMQTLGLIRRSQGVTEPPNSFGKFSKRKAYEIETALLENRFEKCWRKSWANIGLKKNLEIDFGMISPLSDVSAQFADLRQSRWRPAREI